MKCRRFTILLIICGFSTLLRSQEITGKVYHLGKPLKDVNVLLDNSSKGALTNVSGEFSIQANIEDVLIISYVGLETITYKITDYKPIAIQMVSSYNTLDEVIVKGKKRIKPSKYKSDSFNSIFGEQNVESRGYSVTQVKGSDLNLATPETSSVPAIVNALQGKVANYRITSEGVVLRSNNSLGLSNVALWEIDGVTYDGFPPAIDLSLIKDVNVIRGIAGTSRYGARGSGGVIIVTTKNYSIGRGRQGDIKQSIFNKNYYNAEAISYESLPNDEIILPKTQEDLYRSASFLDDDINGLRGLAYRYQSVGKRLEAIQLYRKILSINPEDGQCHRDLAYNWVLINKPLKAWSAYMFWLRDVKKNPVEGLDEVIFHEMERLYMVHELENKVSESFSLETDFSEDPENTMSRLVFEWSDMQHDFEIEVVNPNGQSFKLEFGPSYTTNQSITQLYLDKTIKGTWLFNVTPKLTGHKPLHMQVSIQSKWNSKDKTPPITKVYTFYAKDTSKYELFKLEV